MADNDIPGYVYIIENDSMPGVLKIGFTTRSVDERLRELNASTSIPKPFKLVHLRESIAPDEDERKIHAALSRYNHGKEFFEIGKETAIKVIDQIMAPSIEIARQRKEQLERERKAQAEIGEKRRQERARIEQATEKQRQKEQARAALIYQIETSQSELGQGINWKSVLFLSPFVYLLLWIPFFVVLIVTKINLDREAMLIIYYIVSVLLGYRSAEKELAEAAQKLQTAQQRLKEMDAGNS